MTYRYLSRVIGYRSPGQAAGAFLLVAKRTQRHGKLAVVKSMTANPPSA